jgi:hypothetical protein
VADTEYQWRAEGGVSHGAIRQGLDRAAKEASEWAGYPTILMGESLAIAKGYPFSERFQQINDMTNPKEPSVHDGSTMVNTFWSWKWRTDVAIWINAQGKRLWGPLGVPTHAGMSLQTTNCSDAWSIETEMAAFAKLQELVSHRQFRHYFLTGEFLETSKRSKVTYIFRRLRPTLAISTQQDKVRMLCALCLHPVGYFQNTWAGAMCPTDDVLAHLMLMRGDEKLYWRRANQIPPHQRGLAGV